MLNVLWETLKDFVHELFFDDWAVGLAVVTTSVFLLCVLVSELKKKSRAAGIAAAVLLIAVASLFTHFYLSHGHPILGTASAILSSLIVYLALFAPDKKKKK